MAVNLLIMFWKKKIFESISVKQKTKVISMYDIIPVKHYKHYQVHLIIIRFYQNFHNTNKNILTY